MKKAIIFVFLVASILLTGCNKLKDNKETESGSDIQTSETSNETNDTLGGEPTVRKYQPYTVYLGDTQSNFDRYDLLEDTTKIYAVYDIKEENVGNTVIDLMNQSVEAQYKASRSIIGWRTSLSRRFLTKYGSVMLDASSGQVVELSFKVSKIIDTDPNLEKKTKDECYEIALKYMKHFRFEPDLNDYELEKSELETIGEGTDFCHRLYSFYFQKYIDGVKTTDFCTIGISEYGSLLTYNRGDNIENEIIKNLSVDYIKAKNTALRYAKDICRKIGGNDAEYFLHDPVMMVLDQSNYALSYAFDITYYKGGRQNGEKVQTGIQIYVPIS